MLRKKIDIESYKYRLRINTRDNFREKLGHLLRTLAQKIDGSYSFGIRMETSPKISKRSEMECILTGFGAMEKALIIEVKEQSLENAMRENFTELFEKEKTT